LGIAGSSVERAARESYGRLLAYLASRCGLDAAEDALADAFAAALERWPHDGVPQNPEAWLLVVARNRALDGIRRRSFETSALERVAHVTRIAQKAYESDAEPVDERIGMLFACAHPAVAQEIRAPLMLQIVLGLDAARIASAFLVAPTTMGQRLVRAKRKIVGAGVPLTVPEPEEFPARLDAVLAAIYVTFGQGWDDPRETDPDTRGLAREAIWLGRLVHTACPGEPEAGGLLALMLHAHARRNARRGADGAFVPLDAQDPQKWDDVLIDEAEALLRYAAGRKSLGRFQLEAAIQSAHATRRVGRAPDHEAIVLLYDALLALTQSPVVGLNRAVALAAWRGAAAGIAALDALADDKRMVHYQPYWAARADMLARCGDTEGALSAFERAIGLAIDPAVRVYLASRQEELTNANDVAGERIRVSQPT
jgi:RNA polymerase sigma-70 factor, ECF subfamily